MNAVTLSPETRALADLLSAASVGDTVTFDAMSAAINRPIASRRYLIFRALACVSEESGAVFGSVRGVGYQRIAANDAHMIGAHARRKIRRTAKRTADTITSAVHHANNLSDDDLRKAYSEVNALGLIRHLAADRVVRATPSETKPEPVGITMGRFARALGAG